MSMHFVRRGGELFRNVDYYKPDFSKTIRIMEKTYNDALNHKAGNVTLRALPKSDLEPFNALDLTRYSYKDDKDSYAEELCSLLSHSFEARRSIDDNMIPSVAPILGIADYAAFVAGDIEFHKDTSWFKPVLQEIADYRDLQKLRTAFWYRNFLDICEEILKISSDSGIPFLRGFFSPLDLAAALRGEAIYTDFYEYQVELHSLLDYCSEAIITFAEDIYSLARKYLNSTKYGMWFIDGCVYMSEDIACMISPKLYREFCAPYTQKVIDHFGIGHMHSHSRALYLVKEICSLDNVASLWIATDPNQPRPIDNVAGLIRDARGVCLAIDCNEFKEIEQNFQELMKGNISICLPVDTSQEAENIVSEFELLQEKFRGNHSL